MTKQKQTVSEFFDSYAHDFDAIYGNRNTPVNRFVNKHFRKSMRMRYDKVLAGCEPAAGRSVLDIGCGPGHYSVQLAKRGAQPVLGLDFAPEMIEVAKRHAEQEGVADRCQWAYGDFMKFTAPQPFDYCIVVGFMDYIADPRACINKVLSLTKRKAFFSFPAGGGLLAWQRQMRYRSRCDLFMYSHQQINDLFNNSGAKRVSIEPISRDFFVTAYMSDSDA